MGDEPTNEQLQRWKEYYSCHSGPIPNCREFAITIDALLAAREELAIAQKRVRAALATIGRIATERDSLRAELEKIRVEKVRLREALEPFAKELSQWPVSLKWSDFKRAQEAIATDSMKWLEEKLKEAEEKGKNSIRGWK